MPELKVTLAKSQPIASRLHLAVFLWIQMAVMLRAGAGLRLVLAASDPETRHMRVACYMVLAVIFQWALVGYVWLGIRKTGNTLRELVGGRWATAWDVARDIGIGLAFWLVWWLGLIAFTLVSGTRERTPDEVLALLPTTGWALVLWVIVSMTAGFCEELLYRGYLQRQFLAMSGSARVAVIIQGLLFGAVHSYEGWHAVLAISVMGILFGTLATWRKSLRPGMIAHAWYDGFIGVVVYLWVVYHRG
jgi:membrane protease YdiL (CAAX protease family)